jgi:hypothetical protein
MGRCPELMHAGKEHRESYGEPQQIRNREKPPLAKENPEGRQAHPHIQHRKREDRNAARLPRPAAMRGNEEKSPKTNNSGQLRTISAHTTRLNSIHRPRGLPRHKIASQLRGARRSSNVFSGTNQFERYAASIYHDRADPARSRTVAPATQHSGRIASAGAKDA